MASEQGEDDEGMKQFFDMTKAELVDYLGARGMSTTGSKQALVARAFVAWENGIQAKSSTDDFLKQLDEEYNLILKRHDIPDPPPRSAWSDDVSKWPLVDMGKIFKYLLKNNDYNSDYIGKYKSQKAYSYFTSNFVQTVLWAQVPHKNDKCFLTADVTPSQSVRGEAHRPWILLDNEGNVITSWCSCTAGCEHTCNHVIAVLYKVEYAISHHFNAPSSTDKSCAWNKAHKTIQPSKVEDMYFRTDNATAVHECPELKKKKQDEKKRFDPRRESEREKKPEEIAKFLEGPTVIRPQCVLLTGIAAQIKHKPTTGLPPTMEQIADATLSSLGSSQESEVCRQFGENLTFSNEQCKALEEATQEQSSSKLWHEHRKGRITGSNVRRVARKIDELTRKKNAVVTPLLKDLVKGGPDLKSIPAIQWGVDNEKKAILEFEDAIRCHHKNLVIKRAGLFVKPTVPYIGASPDGIVRCDCHGSSTLEIKCPFKIKGKNVEENYSELDFLVKDTEGHIVPNVRHAYYFQVQSQLAVTGLTRGYFCVSTLTGRPYITEILFNKEFWQETEGKLVLFFKSYITKYLLGYKTLSFCPLCEQVCLEPEECKQQGDNSVCCDVCNLWFHWDCEKYSGKEKFVCSSCLDAMEDAE